MKVPEIIKKIGGSRMMAYLTRPSRRGGIPIFRKTTDPKAERNRDNFVYSDDKSMLRAAERIGDLSERFKVKVDAQGFADSSGVPSDFYSTRCVSGVGQDPAPLPLTNNEAFLKHNGLTETKMRDEDRPWFEELMRLFFGAAVPTDAHFKKGGNTAMPEFRKGSDEDVLYKKLGVMKLLKNLPAFFKMVQMKDYLGILQNFDVLFCYIMYSRHQADKVWKEDGVWKTKSRVAPSEEEARMGLVPKQPADKTFKDRNGHIVDGHFAMRVRDVFAFSGLLNLLFSVFFCSFRTVYLNRFAATYKTFGSASKEARIKLYRFVFGSDVKTMDKTIPVWFIEDFCNELKKYVADEFCDVLYKAFRSSYVACPNGTKFSDDFNPLFGPDPLSGVFTNFPGLPSGIAPNPDIGKLWMTWVYSLVYRDVGALQHPSELEAFLAGRNLTHGLQDSADDASFLTNDEEVAAKLPTAKSRYAILEISSPNVYLGDVYSMSGGEKRAFPNIVTYAVNEIAREHDVSQMPIENNAFGMAARDEVYSKAPTFKEVSSLMSEIYLQELGFDPHSLMRRVAPPVTGDTPFDLEFKMNPDAIYYKFDPSEVSPDLLNASIGVIPAKETWDIVRKYLKVPNSSYASSCGEAASVRKAGHSIFTH